MLWFGRLDRRAPLHLLLYIHTCGAGARAGVDAEVYLVILHAIPATSARADVMKDRLGD